MGGTCAIGYENEDGSVSYMLVADADPWDFDRLFKMNERLETDMVVASFDDYFYFL